MADSQPTNTQGIANILNRLSKYSSHKFAQIVFLLTHHKKASSLGALAGFAIAVVFTWKYSRPPVKPRREQKQTGPESTSSYLLVAHEFGSISELQSIQNIPVGDFHPPRKIALAEGVKKKLRGSRKMTCQLLGVVLEESTPEELLEHVTVRSSAVTVLLEISKFCDIYLMERIIDDESGERVMSVLESAGVFRSGSLLKDKVLFCSTENGRSSFVRQLEPDWHVDTNAEILSQMTRFVRNPLYITSSGSSISPESSIASSTSLESYFVEESAS